MKRKLAENIKRVTQRIEEACTRSNRSPSSVTMVAVTKYVSIDVIRTLVELGVRHIGESRVQELTRRAAAVHEWLTRRSRDASAGVIPRPIWHMIGHLQRNKVKTVLPWVDLTHSVDTLRLAEEINTFSAKNDRVTPILLQVNATGEANKHGVAVAAATHVCEQLETLPAIELCGLMAMGPLTDDRDAISRTFWRIRELFDEITGGRICGPKFTCLSMGMSNDFDLAIEAGATHVRVGSALFEGIDLGDTQEA